MQSSYLLLNGIRYHYYHTNLADGLRPALLLHGLASNARIWEKMAPGLAASGLVLYAPDLRGHGLSDKPDGDYGFATFTNDLAAFVDACELRRPVLIGHSWGAMLALEYAARFAIGPRSPAAVVLVDGGVIQLDDIPGATWESTRQRLSPPSLVGTPLEVFLQRISTLNTAWQPDEQDIQIILANFEIDQDEQISPRLAYEQHMKIVEAMWGFATYQRFQHLHCPVLAIPARPTAPANQREIDFLAFKERGIQRVTGSGAKMHVHWMEDSIHDIPLQRPAELTQVILEFLKGVK